MIEGIAPSPSLVALLRAFAEFAGLPDAAAEDPLGLEIEAGPYVARVLPDPNDDRQFLIEIDVCPRDEAGADALEVLHRVNYAARFVHPWTAGIDGGDTIVMYARRAVAATDAGALEALVGDGIDRAAALRALWTAASRGAATASGAPLGLGAIRG